jgi:hypothetical protein
MLNSRAIAVQGLGFGPAAAALQGFWPSAGEPVQPPHPGPGSGGRLMGLHFRSPRPDARLRRGRKDEILFLKA